MFSGTMPTYIHKTLVLQDGDGRRLGTKQTLQMGTSFEHLWTSANLTHSSSSSQECKSNMHLESGYVSQEGPFWLCQVMGCIPRRSCACHPCQAAGSSCQGLNNTTGKGSLPCWLLKPLCGALGPAGTQLASSLERKWLWLFPYAGPGSGIISFIIVKMQMVLIL